MFDLSLFRVLKPAKTPIYGKIWPLEPQRKVANGPSKTLGLAPVVSIFRKSYGGEVPIRLSVVINYIFSSLDIEFQ